MNLRIIAASSAGRRDFGAEYAAALASDDASVQR
jgi:hypothetical protein